MDRKHSFSPHDLYARLGSESAPIIVNVRRDADFAGADTLVADAFHRSSDHVERWRTDLPSRRQTQAGRIALWTKGDSVTRFGSIAITPIPVAEERF